MLIQIAQAEVCCGSKTLFSARPWVLEMIHIVPQEVVFRLKDVDGDGKRHVGHDLVEELSLLVDFLQEAESYKEMADALEDECRELYTKNFEQITDTLLMQMMAFAVASSNVSKEIKQMAINNVLDIIWRDQLSLTTTSWAWHPNKCVQKMGDFVDGVRFGIKDILIDQNVRLLLENQYHVPKGCSDKHVFAMFVLSALSKSGVLFYTHYPAKRPPPSHEVRNMVSILIMGARVSLLDVYFMDPHFKDNFVPSV